MSRADFQTQLEFEYLYNKNQKIDAIKNGFKTPEILSYLDDISDKYEVNLTEFGLNVLTQIYIHKQADMPTMLGLIGKFYASLQESANNLYILVETDILDFDESNNKFIKKWDIPEDIQKQIDIYQYPLPMLIEPSNIVYNKQNGYYTKQDSILLKKDNHHEEDVCLDHINKVNKVKYSLNENVLSFVKNKWKGINKPKEGEMFSEFQKRVRAFNFYNTNSEEVHKHILIWGNKFYLTHKYDKRGRCYSQGYHINYQGNDYNKASIEFNNKEIINNNI